MKRIAVIMLLVSVPPMLYGQGNETKRNEDSFYLLSPVEVKAIRAAENAPFSKTNLSKREIAKLNLGQDIPFLLNQTPSVVVNADAGNGIGYTGIRIRGTDATRINITLNGIPYNDAESQGSFFVNLPDFSSSVNSVQIQRGTGTSSNGAGAFGASINMSTNEPTTTSYAELNNTYGSFNTWKNTVKAGTGLLNDLYTVDVRLSSITSDGFIDRASSQLRSAYFSVARLGAKSSVRFNLFSGKEKTYQAWYGVSAVDLDAGNRTINYAGMEKPGTPYDNETDNYTQTHYQLFYSQAINPYTSLNAAVFLTRGNGYYEQYKSDEAFSDYGLADPMVNGAPVPVSDFIRQLWLDNDFYGTIFSMQYRKDKNQLILGGAYTQYDGRHYGDLIWSSLGGLPAPAHRWYDHPAHKSDFNSYAKFIRTLQPGWELFTDLQYRQVNYELNGFRDNPNLRIDKSYHFLNPKMGISYRKRDWFGYFSYGAAAKEPNRDDFEAGAQQLPRPEKLHDFELGIERKKTGYSWAATLYYMRYKDQLVLTGKINDVGAYTRTNIPTSFRAGIELQGSVRVEYWITVAANISFSRNKVLDFIEYIDDYDNGGQKTNKYTSTDIALSPAVVGGATVNFIPVKSLEISLLSKYVSKQYLDNVQSHSRILRPYYVQDARVIYTPRFKGLKEVNLIGQVNNVFNKKYEPNGYTFSYIFGGETITENYYFPMAGTNFLLGINLRF